MKMRNPLKPKNKARRFAELQEDQGFTDAQFESPETPSMFVLQPFNHLNTKHYTIVPWNAIGLATLLFTVGGILLALGILIKIGTITSEVCIDLWIIARKLGHLIILWIGMAGKRNTIYCSWQYHVYSRLVVV